MARRDDDEPLTPAERALRSQKRPSKVIDFPGLPGVKAALLVPSDDEIAAAQAAASNYLTETLKLDAFKLSLAMEGDMFKAEEERQLLARVLRSAVDEEASFGSDDDLRKLLNPDRRRMLMRHLGALMDEHSPFATETDPERIREMVADLKEAGALSEYLTSCDFGTLRSIALSLAEVSTTRPSPSS